MKSQPGYVQTAWRSRSELTDDIIGLQAALTPSADSSEASSQPCYVFKQWPHQVSGIIDCTGSPVDVDSPAGRLFSPQWELRWQQQGSQYDVLLLSTQPNNMGEFSSLGDSWWYCDRTAQLYPPTETRFPKGFIYPNHLRKRGILQRYFIDAATSQVQFVAIAPVTHQ